MEKVTKKWGSEEIIVNNELYCGKFLNIRKGCYCSVHFHKIKDETFYVLKGRVEMVFKYPPGNILQRHPYETRVLEVGESMRMVPGTHHRFTGLEDSVIIEFSTQDFNSDSYRLQESGCE
jgi:mannose-6-phosphate isomerase-like protein (cupin superfamily)